MNKVEEFNDLFGIRASKIEEFNLQEVIEGNILITKIRSNSQSIQKVFVVTFYNVFSLKLNFDGKRTMKISSIIIDDRRSDQIEGLNFFVEDYEAGTLSFYCESFEIIKDSY